MKWVANFMAEWNDSKIVILRMCNICELVLILQYFVTYFNIVSYFNISIFHLATDIIIRSLFLDYVYDNLAN